MKFDNIPTWEQWKSASSSFLQIRAHKPKLVCVDNLVKQYPLAHGAAKLTVLKDLKHALTAWADDKANRQVGTGRGEAMQALWEIVLRKLYELDGWAGHQYILTSCVGYRLGTGAYDENKVATGPDPWTTRRRIETVEIGDRVIKLTAAIRDAFGSYQAFKAFKSIPDYEDRKTLKIFMAPEFYFRGPYGAYQDIGWNAKIMAMMRQETSKTQYDDWLFVLGTALYSTDKEVKQGNKMVKVGNLLENYALVQKGGSQTNEIQDLIVAKEFPSHVDFKHPGLGNLQWFDPAQSQAKVGGQMQKHFAPEGGRIDPVKDWDGKSPPPVLGVNTPVVSEKVGGTIFTKDGILFGLEVCRDHLIGRLRHCQEAGTVLIQLVPSCGAHIEHNSIACVSDGIILNVDGAGSGTTDVLVNSGGGGTQVGGVLYDASDGNSIAVYDPARIPWPGLVRADAVANI
jgi:hypothetical protein